MTDISEWWRDLMAATSDHDEAIRDAYQQLENAGLINRVVLRRYICKNRGCVLATIIGIDGLTIARTNDYKLAPRTNLDRSVEVAREKNTLDGNRWWPGHTFDVRYLDAPEWSIDMNCRHGLRSIQTEDILTAVAEVIPGHPAAPIRI